MKLFLSFSLFILLQINSLTGQSDIELINQTLNNYIEGSTNGQPALLQENFHEDLNLYSIGKDQKLNKWSGQDYIKDTKEGSPTGEGGKVISIDFENNIAVAKVEISHPKDSGSYVDFFMLLKIEGKWTIVHKAWTKRTSNKEAK